eukprot:TRINITY_DN10016_c0_g1_i1.p1 TRINITY_DN10016_c0_g1~~TRINITY_DN10016_c0_g1_i1.p1  ORF type:complete len:336 (+),score=16.14 TRINITY_DN10016_c0_g1_i1:32-1009(+)
MEVIQPITRSSGPLRKSTDKWKEFVNKNNRFSDNNNYTLRVVTCFSEQSPVSREEYEDIVLQLQKYGMKRIGRDLFALLAAKFFDYNKHHFVIPLDDFAVILFKVNKYKEDSNKGRGSSRRRITISNLQDQIESQFSDPVTENVACKKTELLLRKYFQIETFEKDVTAYHPELTLNVTNMDELIIAMKRIKPKKANRKEGEDIPRSLQNGFEPSSATEKKSSWSASESEEEQLESAMVVECKAPQYATPTHTFAMRNTLDLALRPPEEKTTPNSPEVVSGQTFVPTLAFPAAYAELFAAINQKTASLMTIEDVVRFKDYIARFNS